MSTEKPGTESQDSAVALEVIRKKCDRWEQDGIITVACEYSGEEGIGTLDYFRFADSRADFTDLDPSSSIYNDIYSAFETLAFAEVTTTSDGGGGKITVDVKTRRITRSEYYIEPTKVYVSQRIEI